MYARQGVWVFDYISVGGHLGGRVNSWGSPELYWATFTKYYIYNWKPELKPSRLAPLLGDMIKGGGLGVWS